MATITSFIRESAIVRLTAGFALAAGVLALFGWLLTGPVKDYSLAIDAPIRNSIRQMQSPMWTQLFLAVTQLGSTLYLVIIGCGVGVVFLFLRWFRPVLLLIVVMAGQAILHHGGKWLFERPRPSALIMYRTAEGFSFPSGHAIAAVCLYGMIAWIVARQLENPAIKAIIAIVTAILVFMIGMSRVYIGIHYPTDVLAGFIGGMIWLAAVMSVDRKPL